jgi:hypothetical protein
MRDDEEVEKIQKVKCVQASDAAIKVRFATGREKWIPQSLVHDDSSVFQLGDEGELVVAAWWWEKHGGLR